MYNLKLPEFKHRANNLPPCRQPFSVKLAYGRKTRIGELMHIRASLSDHQKVQPSVTHRPQRGSHLATLYWTGVVSVLCQTQGLGGLRPIGTGFAATEGCGGREREGGNGSSEGGCLSSERCEPRPSTR